MGNEFKLLRQEIVGYDISSWKGQYAFEYFARVSSFLQKNNSLYAGLLAQPVPISREGRIIALDWVSHLQAEEAQGFSWQELSVDHPFLAQRMTGLFDYARILASSGNEEEQRWGSLLGLLVANPNDYHYFVQGQDVVLAGWGIVPKSKMSPIEEEAVAPVLPPSAAEPRPADIRTEPIAPDVPITSLGQEYSPPPEPEFSYKEATRPFEDANQNTPSSKNEPNIPPDGPEILEKENLKGPPPVDRGEGHKKSGFWRFWWLLLLLLVSALIWRQCRDKAQGSTLLPDQPGVILPIDTTEVVVDDDTIRNIVGNRVNVVLKKPNTNLVEFAQAFKEAYPDEAYEIIYYDTLTHRLQIQVPAEVRETFMKELPSKVPAFKLLIWHESLFKRNRIPSDPDFQSPSRAWYFPVIKAPGAWDKTMGDPKVVVAIIDDGFDLSHPELQGRVVSPWNVVERSTNVFSNPRSLHGSHVAGTALANKDNGSGLAGIAPLCSFMPIQVADRNGTISSTAIIDALLYAIGQGAEVVNMSLGLLIDPSVASLPPAMQYGIIDNLFLDEEAFWEELYQIAEESGVTVVIAAGNENILAGIDPMQRSPIAIKVAAVDQSINKASFSNYGAYATVCAPGVAIFSSVPHNKYSIMQGTSMAAPIVAGGVALMKSANPDLNPDDIRKILVSTARKVSNEMGPLIQLDAAISAARGDAPIGTSPDDCSNIQQTIDSLLQVIEQLRSQCPNGSAPDTMMMPDVIENLDFTIGRWKSTTYLHNDDGEPVTIYFDIYPNGQGKITLVEPNGIQCLASINLSKQSNALIIDQPSTAVCSPGEDEYSNYHFRCQADSKGVAQCHAQNKRVKANHFNFNLVKIQ